MLFNDKYIKCTRVEEENKTSSGLYFVEKTNNSDVIKAKIIDNVYWNEKDHTSVDIIFRNEDEVICLKNKIIDIDGKDFYIKKKYILESNRFDN